MKKRAVFPLILMMASALTLSGCGKEEENEKAEALKPLKEITQDVMDCGVEFPEMVEVTEDNFQIKYSLTADDYEEFSVRWAGTSTNADEICIIKAKDLNKVKDAVNGRFEGQKEVYKDYAPEEYDMLDKSEVKTKGDYVYWICCDDNAKAEKALTDDLK